MGAGEGLGIGGHHRRSANTRRARWGHTSVEWLTPKWLLDRLGPFDLDPCASVDRPWPTAEQHYTIEDDGLAQKWKGRVWLNPPYGKEAAKWLARLAEHGRGTALVFARTETEMFHKYVWPCATGMLFLRGRLDFYKPDGTKKGNAGGPSVLIAYGHTDFRRLVSANIPGVLLDTAGRNKLAFRGRCTRKGNPFLNPAESEAKDG